MLTPVPDEVLAAMVRMCFSTMPAYYRSGGLRAVVTWEVTGRAGGRWQTELGDGACNVVPGGSAPEQLRLTLDAVDFVALCLGVSSGPSLYLGGRMRAKGSRVVLARLARAFATPPPSGR